MTKTPTTIKQTPNTRVKLKLSPRVTPTNKERQKPSPTRGYALLTSQRDNTKSQITALSPYSRKPKKIHLLNSAINDSKNVRFLVNERFCEIGNTPFFNKNWAATDRTILVKATKKIRILF